MNDDARDLTASRAGDQEAFARLYDRHAGVVLSLCRRHCPGEADDATQEAFIRAYDRLDRLDGAARFRPWLFAIARRVCSERRRAANRRSRHEELAVIQQGTAPPPPTQHESADKREQLDRLDAALDELPDDQRLAIHLFYLDSDPVTAAADALGLSRSGFYKLLGRARHQLAQRMREVTPS